MLEIVEIKKGDKNLLEKAFAIRNEVFVIEQVVDQHLEFDEFEDESQHYLVYSDNEPIATARWRKTTKGIKLERFAIRKSHRKKNIGTLLLKFILEKTIPLNKTIYLHSQAAVAGVYQKNGFKIVGGSFVEADILHYSMQYLK
ncbi:MAG: GNAT family N-acetyltransferase [Bacteroidales bacterium]|nr:GNAT family N-acetyltransferase [Bacteroidales bacterium]